MSEETIPPPPPEASPAPDNDPVFKFGQELKKSPGFSKSLDVVKEQRESNDAPPVLDKQKPEAKAKPDPIATKNAENKKEAKPEGDKKPTPFGKRSSSLMEEPENKKDDKEGKEDAAPKPQPKEAKSKESDDEAVTDEDIQQELENPHKSEKANKRFRELYRRMMDAEKKSTTTDKQLREKEAKLAEIEKKLEEAARKATDPDEETKKKLDEYDMLRRQYELENDPQVKEVYDGRISQAEDAIASVFEANRVAFKDGYGNAMTAKDSYELVRKAGGFRGFMRKHPELADQILDGLNAADRQEVQASISRQIILDGEKKSHIQTEKSKAKEYFENKAKEQQEAAAKQPTFEKLREARLAKLESVKTQILSSADIFKDAAIPDDASDEERERLSEDNKFVGELRETLASHLSPQNDDEFIDTAIAATLALKFKREKMALAAENAQLKKDIERIKNSGRTTPRGAALPPSATLKDANKPATNFGAALDMVQRGR